MELKIRDKVFSNVFWRGTDELSFGGTLYILWYFNSYIVKFKLVLYLKWTDPGLSTGYQRRCVVYLGKTLYLLSWVVQKVHNAIHWIHH